MYTIEELLQALKVGAAFEGNQSLASRFPRVIPALREQRSAGGGVVGLHQKKSSMFNQSLVESVGKKHIIADRTADREIATRDHAVNHQGVTEYQSPSRTEHAQKLAEDMLSAWNVTQSIVGKCGVKIAVRIRQRLRGVTLLKAALGSHLSSFSQTACRSYARFVDVDPKNPATTLLGDLQSIASGAATEFEHG